MANLKDKSIAVVGAGVSGLAAAHRLRQRGAQVTVYESSDQVGGRTLSLRKGGFTFDLGALMMMPAYQNVLRLAKELGIEHRLLTTRPAMAIVRDGQHHVIDMQHLLKSLLRMRLLSKGSVLKILKLLPIFARHWRRFNYENMGDLHPFDGETIHAFCLRVLNEEINDYLASPLIRAGSLIGTQEAPIGDWLWQAVGFRYPTVLQWDQGMDVLAQSLAQGQDIRFSTEVTQVRNAQGRAVLHTRGTTGEQRTTHDACILAVPPTVAHRIAPSVTREQHDYFSQMTSVPLISLHLGLRTPPESQAALILIPEKESGDLQMVQLDHNKAPGRAPAGKGMVTLWASKAWTQAHWQDSDAEIQDQLTALARPFVGDVRPLIEVSHVQRREHVVGATCPGHFTRLHRYMASRDLKQPLFFCSDTAAVGIEGVVTSALQACQHVEDFLIRP